MELCREQSLTDKEHKFYKYFALLLIVTSFAYEGYNTFFKNSFSLLGWGYSVLFVFLWLWRCYFTYTCILTDTQLQISMEGLGISRLFQVNLATTESFTNHYQRSFFRKTKIGQYFHRYSSLDPRPQRLLVYREKDSLKAVIFKCSDEFLEKLRQQIPDKFIDFTM